MEINTKATEANCDVELTVGDVATVVRDPVWGEIKGNISAQQDLQEQFEKIDETEKSLENKKVDKTSDANKLYGTDNGGVQTTYNVLEFGKVDDVRYNSNSLVTNKIANLDGFLTYDDSELD